MIKKSVFIIFIFLFFIFSNPFNVFGDQIEDITNKINEYSQKLEELKKSKNTLSNQINYLNSQVELTSLKINQTESSIKLLESEISNLTIKIDGLDIQLNQLTSILIQQISQNYKLQKRIPLFAFFVTSDLNNYLTQHKYVAAVQKNNQENLLSLETVRTNYDLQKAEKTKKQQELEVLQKKLAEQKNSLAKQKVAKDSLLKITQNDEKKYKDLLDTARSELAAIEAVIAGLGVETKGRSVNEGDKIATVIEGKSCSSSGTHLHFMVKKQNGEVQNPFNYLKKVEFTDYSGGDSFNPTGGWNWPLSPQISFNQGYGATWAIRNTWVGRVYSFHTGIDISGSSSNVYATQKGTLYMGSYFIKSQNCTLKYVRIENNDTKIDTLNLHVNYF